MAASGRKTGRLPEPHFSVQIGDTFHCLENGINHGFQRFTLSFNRTAVSPYGVKQRSRNAFRLNKSSHIWQYRCRKLWNRRTQHAPVANNSARKLELRQHPNITQES